MICVISLVILSVMGIFSAENRSLAREALDCVLRRVTLRPCNTGFNEKMKARILGFVITRSESGARLLNRYFEPLAWLFVILFVGSSIFAARGIFLFYTTGSCDGLNQSGFCVFDPTGQANQISNAGDACPVVLPGEDPVRLTGVNLDEFPTLNPQAGETMVFIGSYGCEFTRKAYPRVRALAEQNQVGFTLLYYPVKEQSDRLARVSYCAYQQDREKYWQLVDFFFSVETSRLEDESAITEGLLQAGFDPLEIDLCATEQKTEQAVEQQLSQIVSTGFFGTPTVFIGDDILIGPKPSRVYAIALNGLFFWAR
ncbi:MAG: DsbA family protein [Chloroflexota bacterium]|jgi:predicted DsbA family dithiol-disulfide isomerase